MRLRIFFPSTCVGLRYGHPESFLVAFLDSMTSTGSPGKNRISPTTLGSASPRFKWSSPSSSAAHQQCGLSSLLCPHISITFPRWCRNVDLLSIAYAVWPQLRIRLTLSGLTLLRKP